MNSDYNSRFPIWEEFISALQKKAPQISYPSSNQGTVLVGGICGVGHRLVRNAKIFHHARSLGYNTGLFWFPFKDLFYDNEFIFFAEDDLAEKNRFTNEPDKIHIKSGKASSFQDILLCHYIDFDIDKNPKTEWIRRYKRWLFDDASILEVASFHILLIGLLKERWISKIESFLQPIISKEIIGFHIRTGNGEGGDFKMKKREIDSKGIISNFLSEVREKYDSANTILFVATDDPLIPSYIKEESKYQVYTFTKLLPDQGIITGEFSSGETELPQERVLLINSFFEAYADMCILGLLKTLYIAAPSSFLIGSCIFNKLNSHKASEIFIFNSDLEKWQAC